MLVTRVELENIKSYRHLAIDFRSGTTAISGANGAGKSTIVEAIGFALFDFLPYSQKLFVREGENFGKVVIHLLGNDARPYTVERRCGSGAFWLVYDCEADLRVEQRADVQAKLYELLGVERERSLKRLFEDALGVQQGRFTTNFLLSAAERKKSFDTLFQIEDYKNAADYLLATQKEYENQLGVQQATIARLGFETQELENWRTQYTEYRQQEKQQHLQQTDLIEQLSRQNKRREQLERQREQVNALQTAFNLAEHKQQLAAHELANVQERLQAARTAQEAVKASLPAHQAHQQTEQRLQQLRRDERQRAGLLQQQARFKSDQARFQTQTYSWQERLKEVQLATRKLIDLEPLAERQSDLEIQQERLQQQVMTLQSSVAEHRQLADLHKKEGSKQEQLQRQVTTIEPLQPLADLFNERLEAVTLLNASLAERATKTTIVQNKQGQLQQKLEEHERYTGQLQKSEENIARIEAYRSEAETLDQLQQEHDQLSEQRYRLEGNIEGYEKARGESGGGLCPFLREPCLNIKQRGENSLETYFDGLLNTDQSKLVQLEQRQTRLGKRLEQVKKCADALKRLDQYVQRRDDQQTNLQRVSAEQAQLEQEIATLQAELAGLNESEQRLPAIQAAFEESKRADEQVRRLEGLRLQLKQLEEQAQQRTGRMQELKQQVQELTPSKERLEQVKQELRDLDDPRGTSREQRRIIQQEPVYRQQLEKAQQQLAEVEQQLTTLEQQLAAYATLDQLIGEQEARLRQVLPGHTTYLQNEPLALQLPEREQGFKLAQQKAEAEEQQCRLAEKEFQAASAAFHPQMLEEVVNEYNRLLGEQSKLAESMKNLQQRLSELGVQIQRAEGFLSELEAARKEESTLDELKATLDKFRRIMKEAGPYVLKALLSDISAEADRIFGEIMGDRSAHLAWLNDYEIQLNRKGVMRSFQQLSGGEQMSAALAVRLALLKKLSALNIAFFDEPTQNMDELRRMNLAEQIRRVRGFDQLIVISHDDTFEQGLDSIVRLKKVDGETRLMSEEEVMMLDDQEQIYASQR